jgi:hypothetical protein
MFEKINLERKLRVKNKQNKAKRTLALSGYFGIEISRMLRVKG